MYMCSVWQNAKKFGFMFQGLKLMDTVESYHVKLCAYTSYIHFDVTIKGDRKCNTTMPTKDKFPLIGKILYTFRAFPLQVLCCKLSAFPAFVL